MVFDNLNILSTVKTITKFVNLENDESKYKFLSKDKNNESEVWFYKIKDIQFNGESLYYPNVLGYSNICRKNFKIIYEKVMSLDKLNIELNHTQTKLVDSIGYVEDPVFFFIYNTDNYYHYIYDTLPYLISFFKLKKHIPNLKLLVNYPNSGLDKNYKFVTEPLELLGITNDDLLFVEGNKTYKYVFTSSSYTHVGENDSSPRTEIYKFFKKISSLVKDDKNTPKYIYVSRRVSDKMNTSNIGTNYTTRRVLTNENDLILFLKTIGFTEVYTENLSFSDKINLFRNAEIVVGPIGGGLCNVIFSKKNTRLYSLVSPFFLDINYRFLYSFRNVKLHLFTNTKNVEDEYFKRHMRVYSKKNNLVGEIFEVKNYTLKIGYFDETVSGWNLNKDYKFIEVEKDDCEVLDQGLNSSWEINLEEFKKLLK